MERKLDATIPLWPPNAEKMRRDLEDVAFLTRMKGDRRATFGALDTKLHAKLKRREKREAGAAARKARASKEQQMFNTVVMERESEDSDVDVAAPEQAPTARTWRKKTGIPAIIPADDIPAAMRCSIIVSLSVHSSFAIHHALRTAPGRWKTTGVSSVSSGLRYTRHSCMNSR